jgi:hypothetical protein
MDKNGSGKKEKLKIFIEKNCLKLSPVSVLYIMDRVAVSGILRKYQEYMKRTKRFIPFVV